MGVRRTVIGVPEELREQIFQPFYRAPPGVVESPEGLSPSGAPKTVHDPLE